VFVSAAGSATTPRVDTSTLTYNATTNTLTTTATQVNTIQSSSATDHFITFVDTDNVSAAGENIYTTTNIKVRPSDGRLTVAGAISGASIASFGGISSVGSILAGGTSGRLGFNSASGAVTQLTSKATPVTLNNPCGKITMHNALLNGNTTVSFTFNNSILTASSLLLITHSSGGTIGTYTVTAFPTAGSATVAVRNVTSGSVGEAIVLSYAIINI
jgi:hypothetical protein